jgi:alkylation response protein AidB-like acyl-CoA dehydrogenase
VSIGLTLEQGRWKAAARRIAEEVLAPRAAAVDDKALFPREQLAALGEAGLMALLIPRDLGGQGLDLVATVVAIEQMGWGCPSTAMCYVMHACAALPLGAAATAEQVQPFVTPTARGSLVFSLAASEPGSGTHLWHMDSCARRAPDGGYVIDAYKAWATSAGHSDYYIIPVRREAGAAPDDLTLFLVDGRDPNVQPVGTWDGMGLRGNASTPVRFDGCRVPQVQRLGRDGGGYPLLMAFNLPIYLLGLAALYLGVAQRAHDEASQHVARRVHADTGQALARLEVVQRYLAEMKVRLDRTRAFLLDVARVVDRVTKVLFELQRCDLLDELMDRFDDEDLLLQIAEVKIDATEMAVQVTSDALQISGGRGYKRGQVVERCYRDARAGTLMAPDNDTLKTLVGRRACGLPYPWKDNKSAPR